MAKKRSIFEEVGTEPKAPEPVVTPKRPSAARGAIAIWLMGLFALVAAMIIVGGLTRLTESGLSITEWNPIMGAFPPIDAASWDAEFAKYKEIPQYELLNSEMTLAQFKSIYWWEWGHRQLGRVIGLVWAVGFFWFLIRKQIPIGWTGRLLSLGLLGGLQGALGWWMVASGLSEGMTSVASYRLALHLGLAFAILGLIAWYVLSLWRSDADLLQARRDRNPAMMYWGNVLIVVGLAQILLGALVAGIDAGRGYADWPLMAGDVFPANAFDISPLWRNFLENAGLVQFNHRVLGYILAILGLVAWRRSRQSGRAHLRQAFDMMALMLLIQVALGIVTVINGSPMHIAIIHQAGAIALFVLIIRARFIALYPLAQRVARG